jgi:cytochrome c5
VTPDNFVWHLLDAQRPGTVDTSFIPADNIVNPRALNAIFNVAPRLENGKRLAFERSTGGALNLPEVKTHKDDDYTFGVPHILWDGADSVGIDAALTRVYINIGEYHQEWVRHINPLVGLGRQTTITVDAAQKYSTFWNATQDRAVNMAKYLTRAGYPMHLAEVPGGAAYVTTDAAVLDRGKVVFAETCARCHSSKMPPQPQPAGGVPKLGDKGCIGKGYLDCWNSYWQWTETPEYKAQMTQIVRDPNFLQGNYLSNEARIPVTLLKTETCSAMASNAVEGHVWSDFSSQSYKDLPSVGTLDLYEPVEKKTVRWEAPAGGRGYQRVPSLVSVWATAPYLHNQEVGVFTGDPSVKGRMDAFNDAIQKLLSPGTRGHYVHRTAWKTDLTVETAALPFLESAGARLLGLVDDGEIRVGPIPKGTPVNLIGNINAGQNDPQVGLLTMLRSLKKVAKGLKEVQGKSDAEAAARLTQLVPELLKLSTCPDFEVDRGHEFGAELSPQDKAALIEFLKTL